MDSTQSRPISSYATQVLVAVAASMSFFVLGEVRGWASPGIPSLQGADGLNNSLSYAPMSKEAASWITSGPPIGAIPSALVASIFLQWLGRKKTLMIALSVFGTMFLILATASLHETYGVFVAARSLTGIAVGFTVPAANLYVSECASPKIRGFLGSFPAMFMAFGISVTYLMGAFLNWYHLAYACSFLPFVGLVAMCFMPESPVWLKNKGRLEEAEKSALWLKNESALPPPKKEEVNSNDAEFKPEQRYLLTEQQSKPQAPQKSELWTKKTLVPFGISMMLMIFQQWSGVNVVIFNTVNIFLAAKISISSHLATNIVGVTQLVATALSIMLVDKAGRRVLLIVSGSVMAASQAAMGAYFYVIYNLDLGEDVNLSPVPLTCLIVFMIGYSIGFASIPFLLMGELLPARYKNLLGGIASSFNLLNTFLTLKLFNVMETNLGHWGVFWVYAVNCVIGTIFVYFILPETKGKSLAEIERHFANKSKN